jgi:hypothetical protein
MHRYIFIYLYKPHIKECALLNSLNSSTSHSNLHICIYIFKYIFIHTCIVSKAVAPLKDALVSEPEDHIKAACAWTLGQIGRHTPDHARVCLYVCIYKYVHMYINICVYIYRVGERSCK